MAGEVYFVGNRRVRKLGPRELFSHYSEEQEKLTKKLRQGTPGKKQDTRKARLVDLKTRLIPNIVRLLNS